MPMAEENGSVLNVEMRGMRRGDSVQRVRKCRVGGGHESGCFVCDDRTQFWFKSLVLDLIFGGLSRGRCRRSAMDFAGASTCYPLLLVVTQFSDGQ